MIDSEQKRSRQASATLTFALHLLGLVLLLSQRPYPAVLEPPLSPLKVDLLVAVPPPAAAPPEVSAARPTKLPASIPDGPKSKTSRAELPTALVQAGSARPEVLDTTQPLIPFPQPMVAPTPLVDLGSGTGTGSAASSGAGEGGGAGGDGSGGGGTGGRGGEDLQGSGGTAPQRPDWIVKPLWEMARVNPLKARAHKVDGSVTLSCVVDKQNRARHCEILNESPLNYGFGAATLRLSAWFRIKPPVVNGQPQHNVRVRIPIYFDNR